LNALRLPGFWLGGADDGAAAAGKIVNRISLCVPVTGVPFASTTVMDTLCAPGVSPVKV